MLNSSTLVWVTCRNYEQYLEETIHSVHKQRNCSFSLEVSHDDCGGRFPQGVARNRNYVLEFPNFESFQYLLFLDADDVLPINYIEELTKTANGDDCVVACPAQLFESDTRYLTVRTPITLETLLEGNTIHCSALIPTKLFQASGGFNPELSSHEDWELWCRFAKDKIEFRNCPTTRLFYRRHGGSRSSLHPEGFSEIQKFIWKKYGSHIRNSV